MNVLGKLCYLCISVKSSKQPAETAKWLAFLHLMNEAIGQRGVWPLSFLWEAATMLSFFYGFLAGWLAGWLASWLFFSLFETFFYLQNSTQKEKKS
jgi:hypothetical protein